MTNGYANHPNVRAVMDEEDNSGELMVSDKGIRERIVHVLTIYPKLSMSMLQVGVGTSVPPSMWKPTLASMVAAGIIRESRTSRETPAGRIQSYTVIELVAPTK